jgi:DNA-binding GntR family transcriptional regulator
VKSSAADHLADIEPLGRASVEQRAAQALRELIVSGRLPEGTPLIQRDLAERLGVSQTPIGYALGELERMGLVEVGDTGRALVRRLTREDLEEHYAARLGLEGLAARLGAVAVGEAELDRMRTVLSELDRLAVEQDIDRYLVGRWELHATAYLASGRTRLVAEVERLFWRGERYHRLVLSSRERFARSVASYHDFLVACEAHDPDRAERVVTDSMRWAVDLVADSLPSERELQPPGR